MNKTCDSLIDLMACALQNIQPDEEALASTDLAELYELAQNHAVGVMVCMALEKTRVFAAAEESIQEPWLILKNQGIRKQILFDAERQAVLRALEQAGVWYMPLKGSVLKDWYPRFGMREMCDCDILIDPEKRERVRELFVSLGYTVYDYGEDNHDVYHKPPLFSFEMHAALFSDAFGGLAEEYGGIKERLLPMEGTDFGFCFRPEDFYVYMLAHAYKHYRRSGTGVRTLADIYVMNRYLTSKIDRAYVDRELQRLGLAQYEEESRLLADKLLGKAVPMAQIELPEAERKMLAYYLGSSAYGTLENFIGNQIQALQEDSAEITWKAKLKYCRKRIFPNRAYLKLHYPTVHRHIWLYPFFLVWRVFHRARVNGAYIIRELRIIKK